MLVQGNVWKPRLNTDGNGLITSYAGWPVLAEQPFTEPPCISSVEIPVRFTWIAAGKRFACEGKSSCSCILLCTKTVPSMDRM